MKICPTKDNLKLTAIFIFGSIFLTVFTFIFEGKFFLPFVSDKSFGAFVTNTGAAFGIFKDIPVILSLFALFVLIFFIFIALYSKVIFSKSFFTGVLLFASGIIGNTFQRLTNGYVLDYIKIFDNFPVFNLFDVLITAGAVLLCINSILHDNGEK